MKVQMAVRKAQKVRFLPNIITAFGLACGLFIVFKVNMTGLGTYELLYRMTMVLLLAAVADLLDGVIARAMKATSDFGFAFDSLSDAISFGVAPSILFLKSFTIEQGSPEAFIAMACAMIYTVCGVLRLVRFGVTAHSARDDSPLRGVFIGLPIPAGAMSVVAPNLLLVSPWMAARYPVSDVTRFIILSILMLVVAYLMISKWRFPSVKSWRFHPSFSWTFGWIFIVSFVLFGLFHYFSLLLVIISWGYIFFCLGWNMLRKVRRKPVRKH